MSSAFWLSLFSCISSFTQPLREICISEYTFRQFDTFFLSQTALRRRGQFRPDGDGPEVEEEGHGGRGGGQGRGGERRPAGRQLRGR